jgi:hypothetical protein
VILDPKGSFSGVKKHGFSYPRFTAGTAVNFEITVKMLYESLVVG